jgi:hypothetical protein
MVLAFHPVGSHGTVCNVAEHLSATHPVASQEPASSARHLRGMSLAAEVSGRSVEDLHSLWFRRAEYATRHNPADQGRRR